MDEAELGRIVRAFSVYFQLVNVAERYHRVRRRREYEARDDTPQRASLRNALARIEREGVLDAGGLEKLLDEMSVSLVLTAHPTEAQRRSIRRKHQDVAEALDRLDSGRLTTRERAGVEERLAEEISLLWQTDELRAKRPEVEGEISRTLSFSRIPCSPRRWRSTATSKTT
jgi:phosphoenolpyruvate carboxylase